MNFLLFFLLCFSVFGLLVAFANLHTKYYFTQYGFFTRYPILLGLFLFLLPILGPQYASSILSNLFVMGFWGAMLTSVVASLFCWAIVYTFRITFLSIPLRCGLQFRRSEKSDEAGERIAKELVAAKFEVINFRLALYALLMTVPLFARVVAWAGENWLLNSFGWLAGVVVAFALRAIGGAINHVRPTAVEEAWIPEAKTEIDLGNLSFWERMRAVYLDYYNCFDVAPPLRVVHRRAAGFFYLSLIVVGGVGILYSPLFQSSSQLPALVILLSLLLLVTWVLGVIGFVFDKDRIPVVLVLIALGFVFQFVIPNEHMYRTTEWKGDYETVTASEALSNRIERVGTNRPLVAIAASGGGIRASLWTAIVLEQLEEQIPDFKQRLTMLSSVSGGSIANAYYFDQHVCQQNETGATEQSAGTSSLTATVWGLTYLEIPRLLVGSWLPSFLFGKGFVYYDRGWTQEKTWSHQLNVPDLMISDLAEGVGSGQWPIPIFNSCLQESGKRFLIAPVEMESLVSDALVDAHGDAIVKAGSPFDDLVGDLGRDMRLVTAARLSASFPYATPQSREEMPTCDADSDTKFLNAADGGFYDNSGLISILEVLDCYLDGKAEGKEDAQFALIEIRASPGDFYDEVSAAPGGLVNEILGPPKTIFSVLFGSQSARNRQEIHWFGRLWNARSSGESADSESDSKLKHFVFYLSGGPLSWHLTENEKQQIRAHWPVATVPDQMSEAARGKLEKARKHNAATLEALIRFMR